VRLDSWAAHFSPLPPPCRSPTTRSLQTFRALSGVGVALRIPFTSRSFSAGGRSVQTFGRFTGFWHPRENSKRALTTTSAPVTGPLWFREGKRNKTATLSAFQIYEFHGTQQGTMIHPGQTFNLDYSLAQAFALQANVRLQPGLVGYGQWQTTDKQGPTITPEQAAAHYKANAL
jgi:hypothetical protein